MASRPRAARTDSTAPGPTPPEPTAPEPAAPEPAAPERLPRGRHGLPPEQVSRIQRARMLRALADAMGEQGYVATTVADVLKRAGTSRETFYQQFSSKQDCFIAAYQLAAGQVLAELELAAGGPGEPLERFDRAIGAYLDALASEPAFARLFMVEVYAAGEEVLAHRAAVQERFVTLVADAFGAASDSERFACEALVAAVITLVTTRLAARDLDGLRALRAPLVELVRQALAR